MTKSLDRVLKHQPLVWLAAALCCGLSLAGDTRPVQWQRVVFLGRGTAQTDDAFQSYVKTLRRTHATLSKTLRVDFVDISNQPADQQHQLLASVAATKPALLLAPNGNAAKAAARYAPTIPLVFSTYIDPIEAGIVSAMEQRPEPVTGIWVTEQLDGKRLEVLRDAYPGLRRIAVLTDRSWNRSVNTIAPVEQAASTLGLDIEILLADNVEQAQALFDGPRARSFDAWIVPRSYVAVLALPLILERLQAWHKPLIVSSLGEVRSGAPLSYGVDTSFIWPGLTDLTARILEGESAGDIPIQRPHRFVLAVRTSADTGLPPPSIAVMRRADVVIR